MPTRFIMIIGGWGYSWSAFCAVGAWATWGAGQYEPVALLSTSVGLAAVTTWVLWDGVRR